MFFVFVFILLCLYWKRKFPTDDFVAESFIFLLSLGGLGWCAYDHIKTYL